MLQIPQLDDNTAIGNASMTATTLQVTENTSVGSGSMRDNTEGRKICSRFLVKMLWILIQLVKIT